MARFSILALLSLAASAIASQVTYMRFLDASGAQALKETSTDAGFTNAMAIQSYEFKVQNTVSIGASTGGAGAGKASFDTASFTYLVNGNTPGFFQAVASGSHYSKVILLVGKTQAAGNEFTYATYTFGNVFLTSQDISGTSAATTAPTITVTFQYEDLNMSYTEQNPDGTAGTVYNVCWDQVNNQNTC